MIERAGRNIVTPDVDRLLNSGSLKLVAGIVIKFLFPGNG